MSCERGRCSVEIEVVKRFISCAVAGCILVDALRGCKRVFRRDDGEDD